MTLFGEKLILGAHDSPRTRKHGEKEKRCSVDTAGSSKKGEVRGFTALTRSPILIKASIEAMNTLTYKGYHGCFGHDSDADIFQGEVLHLNDVVTFQDRSIDELTGFSRFCR